VVGRALSAVRDLPETLPAWRSAMLSYELNNMMSVIANMVQ
jgi:hypothetical protein